MANAMGGGNQNELPRKVIAQKRAVMICGKNKIAPPDGFYCYYPEIFEKQNVQIFHVMRVARKPSQLRDNR